MLEGGCDGHDGAVKGLWRATDPSRPSRFGPVQSGVSSTRISADGGPHKKIHRMMTGVPPSHSRRRESFGEQMLDRARSQLHPRGMRASVVPTPALTLRGPPSTKSSMSVT